jgi:hypothetical protein
MDELTLRSRMNAVVYCRVSIKEQVSNLSLRGLRLSMD